MELGIAVATFVISIVTALFVYLKNPKSGSNVYFGLLIFFIGVYPIFNYLAVHSASNEAALVWAKLILLVSIPQGPLLYFFAKTFPGTHFIFNKKIQLIIIGWAFLNAILSLTGLIFAGVVINNESITIKPGPLAPSFGLLHVLTIIAGLMVLHAKSKTSVARERGQLTVIFIGILVSFSLTFLITIVLPVFMQNTILLAISPLFLAFSVIMVAYAIVAQRLFDIRSTVARTMGYLLALITLITIYTVVVILFTRVTLATDNPAVTHILYLGGVVGIVVTFHPLKTYFDKFTDRFFFRDSYDTSLVLDELGDVITNEVKLQPLVNGAIGLLLSALKPSSVAVYILDDTNSIKHSYHSENIKLHITNEGVASLLQLNQLMVEVDSLQEKQPRLYEMLQVSDIALIARLATSKNTIGYMVLGYKQNGDIYHKKDLAMIAVARDELAVAIQNALRFEEIQKFNETLQAKVDEATAELQKSNAKLKSLDKAKDEFVSMASHQLRTPLTSVKGYISMVLDGDVGDITPTQRKLLEESYASSQRMVYLIGDFLNVSRISTGRFVLEPNSTNVATIVHEEVEQLRPTSLSRKVTLVYEKPEDFPILTLDETKIRQVVMNFIDNAIYYSRPGGDVKIELTKTSKNITFKVKDSGIGVPASERHHLFTKFYRAANARKARPDGTGIGLFMAKKVILAHNGSVIFETTEGQGSTFGFVIPVSDTKHRSTKD